MSHELRIGILATVIIATTVWGYKFMKGKNMLVPSNTYFVTYENIGELQATSPVYIRGLKVGTVEKISLSDDLQKVTAKLDIQRGIRIAKGTEAVVVSTSIMGGKAIVLDIPGPCDGDFCHEPGDQLPGRVQGLFESVIGDSDFDEFMESLKNNVGDIASTLSDSLTSSGANSEIAKTFQDIQGILSNLEGITSQLNASMATYDRQLKGTLENVETFTGALADNSEDISTTLENLNAISTDLKNADIANKAGSIVESADEAVSSLKGTLAKTEKAVAELTTVLEQVNEGNGTLGKLTQDEELYNNLNNSVKNLDLLLQDFRLNPKRYVNVSVFGKKQKEYVVPEIDPAYNDGQN